MAPKGKNVASGSGTKRSRTGATVGSSNRETTNLSPQKFGKQALMHYGEDWYECQQESKYLGDEYVDKRRFPQEFPHIHTQINALGLQYVLVDQGECNLILVHEFYANWNTHRVELNQGLIRDSRVRFTVEALNEFLGTPNCDNSEFLAMIERLPYHDIRHTLCGVNSVARWDRVRNMARIWLKIMCSTLLPCKHTTDVTRERVVLVYRLMKVLPVNMRAILKQNMLKFSTNKRWCLCYGSIITRYLQALQIEEEVHDVSPPPRAPHLVCRLVDVTRTKAHDPSQGLVLTAIDRQARDDSWMGRMFGMVELQLRIGGRPVTEDKMATLAEHYPLTDSAMYLCWIGPAFQERIDDDDTTADEDGSDKDASYDTGPGDGDTDTGR
ncbi:hypothetical protein KY285_003730 [Solanum tuberosum]|nr:hypothetical protein KY285_003730 [Solanum tuberosum]